MKNIFITTAVCIYIAGLCILGYCNDSSATEQSESQMGQSLDSKISKDDSAIEQSESKIGQNIDSSISSEKAQNKAEGDEANRESATGEPMTLSK